MRRSRPTQTPSSEDAELFRAEVGPVRPLRHDSTDARAPAPAPQPTKRREDDADVMRELAHAPLAELEQSEPLSYLRDGYAPKVLRSLGRGHYSVADALDLHHMTASVAADAIAQFLADSRRAGRLCVKIIHGKGLRSKAEGPVLKRLTDKLLRRRDDVIAFRSARAVDGGSGAVVVLLKPSK
jgi:DNA-nicking Smr family endonuclease